MGSKQEATKVVSFVKKIVENLPSRHVSSPLNPCPAEHRYSLPLQQKKPTDLNLHYLPFSMCIYTNNPDQGI